MALLYLWLYSAYNRLWLVRARTPPDCIHATKRFIERGTRHVLVVELNTVADRIVGSVFAFEARKHLI